MDNLLSFILVVLTIVILGAVVVGIYNNLVKLRKGVENTWSNITMELEKRTCLIDNLVATVQGYAAHEKSTLEEVTRARWNLQDAWTVRENAEADIQLTCALDNLLAVAENYPNLQADESFKKLTEELAETEYWITYYQQFYNDTVYIYNNKRQKFPINIVANYFGFEDVEFFETEEEVKEAPDPDSDTESREDESTPN